MVMASSIFSKSRMRRKKRYLDFKVRCAAEAQSAFYSADTIYIIVKPCFGTVVFVLIHFVNYIF